MAILKWNKMAATEQERREKYMDYLSEILNSGSLPDSENQDNYYNFARSLAGSGKSKESVDALSAAMNHGFNS